MEYNAIPKSHLIDGENTPIVAHNGKSEKSADGGKTQNIIVKLCYTHNLIPEFHSKPIYDGERFAIMAY